MPDGWRLGIHIADVSALVTPHTSLDLEAQERGTSIYLPERRLPMLPEEISEDTVSLLTHQERLALSFLVTLGADAEIKDWVIVPSRIKVQRRLTYHEVDGLLAQEPQLATLSRLTRRLKERRLARGGYELKLPEVWVTFTPQGEIQVVVEDQETASRQLVAEAMVLANSLAAQFLAEQRIAAIYRGQPEPREPIKPAPDKSLLELWQDRRRLSRVVMDLTPSPHWGLGLPCYTFATSPIRRYLDLVTHRQLLAAVSGQPPAYRPEELEQDPVRHRAGHAAGRATKNPASPLLAPEIPVGPGGPEAGGPGAGKPAPPLPPHAPRYPAGALHDGPGHREAVPGGYRPGAPGSRRSPGRSDQGLPGLVSGQWPVVSGQVIA